MVERRVRRTQSERRALAEERAVDAAVVWIAARGSSSLTLAGVGEAAGYTTTAARAMASCDDRPARSDPAT
jgi:hypothetical protein